ncbi:GntR family transcriptional regulator [Ferrimonas lipolytica]|uniref:GntR family transcriptional regulator n=1 Tax=Ferrimonas lipolytica TaxID=2724191 RepID=A0A6H1UCP6_9GAMM|nr:GntR family transcriptional regulator [Ferrimonas lipolytica]QIZ76855.1 GntR family transcriptional regulator [Ferrimonas lipolytica]
MQQLIHKTRTQMVVEVLREKILCGEISAGEPLRQSNLANELNVSRIPVREALLQLEAEGLVKFEAHKGATATELSLVQMDELFELRALIEPPLLKRSVPNLSDVQLALAADYLEQLDAALQSENTIDSWSELNSLFHQCLYEGADRPHTIEVVRGLNTSSDRYIRLQLLLAGGRPTAEQEHHQLLKLCQQRNADGAALLLEQHILAAGKGAKSLIVAQQIEKHNR